VAIVTGAGAGIGRAAAVAFAGEGARVVCADLDETTGEETARLAQLTGSGRQEMRGSRMRVTTEAELPGTSEAETVRLARHRGGEALFVRADAADGESVAALVQEAVASIGRLDVFYANAGIVPGGTA